MVPVHLPYPTHILGAGNTALSLEVMSSSHFYSSSCLPCLSSPDCPGVDSADGNVFVHKVLHAVPQACPDEMELAPLAFALEVLEFSLKVLNFCLGEPLLLDEEMKASDVCQ